MPKENSCYVAFRSCRLDLTKACSLLCAFVLLLLPSTAHAGTYIWVTKDAQGNITAQSPTYSGGTSSGQGNTGPVTHSFSASNGGWGGGVGALNSASAGGTITATLTWQPASANDPPPANVLVVESSSASASGMIAPAYPVASASCNDGLGPSGAITTAIYPNPSIPAYSITSGSCQDVKKHLMAGQATLTFTCTLQASATGNQDDSSASAYYSVSVGADSRAVTISANVDPTCYKIPSVDAHGNQSKDANGDLIYAPKAHTPDSDGTMTGDVGLPIDGPNAFTNITYQAVRVGNWTVFNSSYNWFSSLKQSGSSGALDCTPEVRQRVKVVYSERETTDYEPQTPYLYQRLQAANPARSPGRQVHRPSCPRA